MQVLKAKAYAVSALVRPKLILAEPFTNAGGPFSTSLLSLSTQLLWIFRLLFNCRTKLVLKNVGINTSRMIWSTTTTRTHLTKTNSARFGGIHLINNNHARQQLNLFTMLIWIILANHDYRSDNWRYRAGMIWWTNFGPQWKKLSRGWIKQIFSFF